MAVGSSGWKRLGNWVEKAGRLQAVETLRSGTAGWTIEE